MRSKAWDPHASRGDKKPCGPCRPVAAEGQEAAGRGAKCSHPGNGLCEHWMGTQRSKYLPREVMLGEAVEDRVGRRTLSPPCPSFFPGTEGGDSWESSLSLTLGRGLQLPLSRWGN